jgi:hypothetical protein
MRKIKYLIVMLLEKLDHLLDQVPRYSEGRWWRDGDWGCALGLSNRSWALDERWQTGYWEDGDEEVQIQGPTSEERPDDGGAPPGLGRCTTPHYR